jgi:hypothetical protein
VAVVEEKLKTLSEAREILRKCEDELDRALRILEPYAIPFVKGSLRSAKYRIYFIWSTTLSYPNVLRVAKRSLSET